MRGALFALATCVVSAPVLGGPMYKCVQPNGEVVYQDRACASPEENRSDQVHVSPPPRLEDQLRAQQRLNELRREEEVDRLTERQEAERQASQESDACFRAIEKDYDQGDYALKEYASRLCAANMSASQMRDCMDEFEITTIGERLTRRGAELHIRTCIRMKGQR